MLHAVPPSDRERAPGAEPLTAPLEGQRAPCGSPELVLRVGGGREARRVRLRATFRTFGASPRADVQLHDRAVSGVHFRARADRGCVCLEDLGSRNGLWVDGLRVRVADLAPGSVFVAGRTKLVVSLAHEAVLGVADAPEERYVVRSDVMRDVMSLAARYARSTACVVILGESGSGKEGIARAVHEASGRTGAFVAVNAGALRHDALASELFGHVKGAFTGASGDRAGAFQRAHGGTLFLDELGELSLAAQVMLLRVLETKRVQPMGSDREIELDVRLVAATHRDLSQRVRSGEFREDLYYRLCKLPIEVPPLRRRQADIVPLAEHFARYGGTGSVREFSAPALARLRAHAWPGNVRELGNVVTRATMRAMGPVVTEEDVLASLDPLALGSSGLSDEALLDALAAHDFNKTAAARALGIPRSTLRDRLSKVAVVAGTGDSA
ncbi:MAG: sigma 54-interacting transcriptional regulator [Polyangiales bacterium]